MRATNVLSLAASAETGCGGLWNGIYSLTRTPHAAGSFRGGAFVNDDGGGCQCCLHGVAFAHVVDDVWHDDGIWVVWRRGVPAVCEQFDGACEPVEHLQSSVGQVSVA